VSQGYQKRDRAIVDYQLWRTPDQREGALQDWLRGPAPGSLEPGSYFACAGAAQTFGCFAERPWPQLLSEAIDLPALNLGIAGAGPALFRQAPYLELLRNARFVVFQVMSGRSADNSQFTSGGRERLRLADGRTLGADQAWSELLQRDLGRGSNPIWRGLKNRWLAAFGRREVRRIIQETRDNWVAEFTSLIDEVARPSTLLWFSKRTPAHRVRLHSLEAVFGAFPQLVDEQMVEAVARHTEHYVECVTSRGSPQPLTTPVKPNDANTGEPDDQVWTENTYYPSPEMHEDASTALQDTAQAMLRASQSPADR